MNDFFKLLQECSTDEMEVTTELFGFGKKKTQPKPEDIKNYDLEEITEYASNIAVKLRAIVASSCSNLSGIYTDEQVKSKIQKTIATSSKPSRKYRGYHEVYIHAGMCHMDNEDQFSKMTDKYEGDDITPVLEIIYNKINPKIKALGFKNVPEDKLNGHDYYQWQSIKYPEYIIYVYYDTGIEIGISSDSTILIPVSTDKEK